MLKTLSYEEYTAIDAVNQSRLKKILISAKYFKDDVSKKSKAMDLGHAIHEYIEKKNLDGFIIEPEVNKRTKAGREELKKFHEDNEDKRVVSEEVYYQIKELGKSIQQHTQIRKILNHSATFHESVAEGFMQGIHCKGLLDITNIKSNLVLDTKTTRRITKAKFEQDCIAYGYPFQIAFYERLYELTMGVTPKMGIITIETISPGEISLYWPDQELIEYGHEQVDKALAIYKQCIDTGIFPPKQESKGETLSLPAYMRRNR